MQQLIDRAEEIKALRGAAGKSTISPERREALAALATELDRLRDGIVAVCLDEIDPTIKRELGEIEQRLRAFD